MRSIIYMCGGNPQNFDDCVDKFRDGTRIKKISLDLIKEEQTNEQWTAIFLNGIYTWEFEGSKVGYSVEYGARFLHESEKRQRLSVDNANKRLERSLREFEELGLKVAGSEKRFQYPPPTASEQYS